MTIIEPNKNSFRSKLLIYLAVGLVVVEAVLSIFSYNHNVSINRAIKQSIADMEVLRGDNADLKNQLYLVLDLENADFLAAKLGLIKERRPEYLAINGR